MNRGRVFHRLPFAVAAGALILSACGGGGGDDESDATEVAAAPAVASGIDLGGPDVDAAAAVPTNLFPDLVVDDVVRAKKVNLRNLIPADKPVLLWMYAPH